LASGRKEETSRLTGRSLSRRRRPLRRRGRAEWPMDRTLSLARSSVKQRDARVSTSGASSSLNRPGLRLSAWREIMKERSSSLADIPLLLSRIRVSKEDILLSLAQAGLGRARVRLPLAGLSASRTRAKDSGEGCMRPTIPRGPRSRSLPRQEGSGGPLAGAALSPRDWRFLSARPCADRVPTPLGEGTDHFL
jgi:hypothetical protein